LGGKQKIVMNFSVVNKTKAVINTALVKKVTKAFLSSYQLDAELAIIFVADSEIRRLNRVYRRRDKVTDVLSFAERDGQMGDDEYLGDIFIDYQQIKRQAKTFGHSTDYELIFILVHGLLHLLGYDDKTKPQAEQMKQLGLEFIKRGNFFKL